MVAHTIVLLLVAIIAATPSAVAGDNTTASSTAVTSSTASTSSAGPAVNTTTVSSTASTSSAGPAVNTTTVSNTASTSSVSTAPSTTTVFSGTTASTYKPKSDDEKKAHEDIVKVEKALSNVITSLNCTNSKCKLPQIDAVQPSEYCSTLGVFAKCIQNDACTKNSEKLQPALDAYSTTCSGYIAKASLILLMLPVITSLLARL